MQKKKGKFQHSSFLAGAATTAAGRLVAKDGVLKVIFYRPTTNYLNYFCIHLTMFQVLRRLKSISFQAIWPYSGHYLPTEENFREFISFLEENSVDLGNVKVNLLSNHIVCLNNNNFPGMLSD